MVEEFFELDFGDGGVHVSARVEVFRVEAADCPCDASGGIVHVALCFHRLPAVGAEPVVFIGCPFCQNLSVMLLGIVLR